MDTEVKTEVKADAEAGSPVCEFKATIGKDGQLVIEADSEECQRMAIEAASEHGVDVKHVKPKAAIGGKPTTA